MTDGAFQRYLRAKRTVDDRSLAREPLDRLGRALSERAASRAGPLRILEVGAGVGTMIERLLEWDLLPEGAARYTAVDIEAARIRTLRADLPAWARDRGYTVDTGEWLHVRDAEHDLAVRPVAAPARSVIADASTEWDLVVGAALLDVIGLDSLGTLLSGLVAGGWWYFPITYDGATRFVPTHSADRALERYYHQHMDEKPGGTSRAGTQAIERLRARPEAEVRTAAGSDWAVRPVDGAYPADEEIVIEHVLGTIENALGDLDRSDDLTDGDLADWLETRRSQLAEARLTYMTHQLDLLGRRVG